jgi:hypothetical protein
VTETNGTTETIESVDTAEIAPSETAAIKTGAEGMDGNIMTKPLKIRKHIGSTTYDVEVRFNPP